MLRLKESIHAEQMREMLVDSIEERVTADFTQSDKLKAITARRNSSTNFAMETTVFTHELLQLNGHMHTWMH
jgi:hypothetical protein